MRVDVIVLLAVILGSGSPIEAQITIQQPVVETFGVGTAVSVPDRGSISLGGVNTAAQSRTTYGPVRTGTTRTSSMTSSSVTAHVSIIDIHEIDEAILNSGPASGYPISIRGRPILEDRTEKDRQAAVTLDKIAKFEKLAQQAETAGKTGLAKLHWQMAAKYGSSLAQAKLSSPSSLVAGSTARN